MIQGLTLLLAFLALVSATPSNSTTNGTTMSTTGFALPYVNGTATPDPCFSFSFGNCSECLENSLGLNCSFCPLQNLCLLTEIAENYTAGGCWGIPRTDCEPPGEIGGIRAVSIYAAIVFIVLIGVAGKFWKTSADFKKRVALQEAEEEIVEKQRNLTESGKASSKASKAKKVSSSATGSSSSSAQSSGSSKKVSTSESPQQKSSSSSGYSESSHSSSGSPSSESS